MSTIYVKLEDVIKLIYDQIGVKLNTNPFNPLEFEKLPHKKPAHGPCCTCQVCGWDYEHCVCSHNEIIEWINNIEKFDRDI